MELPADCHDEFARLARLIQARPGKFQLLVIDCRDERLRERVIERLDDVLRLAGRRSARVRLTDAAYPDFAAVAKDIVSSTASADVIHLTGGAAWFNAARWQSFNIQRGPVTREVKANLLLWLDPESIAAMASIARDFWAWRAAVIAFHDVPQLISVADRAPFAGPFDDRALSERTKRIAVLREVLQDSDLPDDIRLGLALEMGDLFRSIGDLDHAEAAFREIASQTTNTARDYAIIMGRIADILEARGDLDEALRIRTEQQLPVYTRLGDVRAVAITQGKIADILQARGNLDEALRIRTEQELPVYNRLGDVRAVAITQGEIADILQARGELDEALRIRTGQELPVYIRLGDVHAVAIAQGKIADTLQARGELDEALRIRTEQELPVYTRIGDVRLVAITRSKIADILQLRGQYDEALRIHTEETLPVFKHLGATREYAIIQNKIADILQARVQPEGTIPSEPLKPATENNRHHINTP